MTAKEKARDILNKYSVNYPIICKTNSRNLYKGEAKYFAIMAIDEILEANHTWHEDSIPHKYWQMVKKEIINS